MLVYGLLYAVVLIHLLFIIFVLLGGVLVLRWRWVVWVHLPAVAWGVIVEVMHLQCPLTPLENSLRRAAGEVGYSGGFIEQYLLTLLYPAGLTPQIQLWLGAVVVVVNVAVYGVVIWRALR
ncbi:MAG: DUF2784 domain-containing protein [Gammaproteobacteria bacterium]|nr:DUF2784 domain-containing protein [Gammaproteobacteria bacterium]MBU2064328.1 DUF2784 domain-containing protein [Gammaproteobacteria bacterium]MBU2179396.1 DUF2784 domain-containing protein [Gammaproteobacteria bacterium]MBU2255548.1 DUF2784 domain-containing protein [Gammaproteobacteria bacterium]MBU2293822.1 DUF2784 domain-containing protein [Gammaproteobacteria bacterium]